MNISTPALAIYLMADTDTVELARAAVAAGATAIEVGIPYSDPLADGPTIQRAANRSLAAGMTTRKALDVIAGIRSHVDVPIVPMTYASPVMALGEGEFCRAAAAAGADGLIVPDIPSDEAGPLSQACREHGLDLVPLLAPTSSDQRIELACRNAGGFVYLVSVVGHHRSPRTAGRSGRRADPAHPCPYRAAAAGRVWHLHTGPRPGGTGGRGRRSRDRLPCDRRGRAGRRGRIGTRSWPMWHAPSASSNPTPIQTR